MQPDVKIAMTIHPEISHEIMEKTFEGFLLAHLLVPLRTATGYQLCAPNGISPVFTGLNELITLAEGARGDLAGRMLPVIVKAHEENLRHVGGTLHIDEVSEALGIDFDVTTVLQEICSLHTNRHPYFQVLWSTFVEGHERRLAQHGTMSGGADLVTATGVTSLNAKNWLDQQTKEALNVQADIRRDGSWSFRGVTPDDGYWHIGLPIIGIASFMAAAPLDELRIRKVGANHYELERWSARDNEGVIVDVFDDLDEVKLAGVDILELEEADHPVKFLRTMGLSEDEWELHWDEVPYAVHKDQEEVEIRIVDENLFGLFHFDAEVGRGTSAYEMSQRLKEILDGTAAP
jgi:hypothetical protein